ncbi:MAG: anti-sigma-factor antagonist [Solirubrobacterales bacterium]|nr:anti-sigma-factor antagonist [Solirubrobacterales bacterium]
MDITTEYPDPHRVVLRLSGRLDLVSAAQLRKHVERAVDDGHVRVVTDLAGVAFIDSTGLGALIAALKHARQAGGELRMAAAGEQVTTVLKLTRLDRVLRAYATVDDALDGL